MYRVVDTERLWEALDYNPKTGIFRWRKPRCTRIKIGDIAGSVNNKGYWQIAIDKKLYKAHRLAWQYITGIAPDREVDHKNNNRSDNRFENLRLATDGDTAHNALKRRDNTSGYKGVSFHKVTGKWSATIAIDGKSKHLGLFNTPEEAHAAYVETARKHFKAFARGA